MQRIENERTCPRATSLQQNVAGSLQAPCEEQKSANRYNLN